MTGLGLRLRIFLFFAVHAIGGIAIVAGALATVGVRDAEAGLLHAAILSAFGLAALAAGIWLLFDENVARPLEALAAALRARAHGGVTAPIDGRAARYLGDLAPAADALASALAAETMDAADRVAAETAAIADERARLTALLTEIPVAIVLVGPAGRIALYDGQAAEALSRIAPPRLGAPVTDYLDTQAWDTLRRRALRAGHDVSGAVPGVGGTVSFACRLRPRADGGIVVVLEDPAKALDPGAARPLVYDFALLDAKPPAALADTPLTDLPFAVFDTETTGLLPHRDALVQIAALRMIGTRAVPGEVFETLVDPGRPIPAQAQAVHGISDARVAGAPPPDKAAAAFHEFARGAVLVAHNAPFDLAFLRAARRDGLAWDHPVLDTVLLSAVVFGADTKHTLDALCARLGIVIPEAERHTAMGDARATAKAFACLVPMLAARGIVTLGDTLEACRRPGRIIAEQKAQAEAG